MVKIHFLQKVLKKWPSFRKKNSLVFSIKGGRGVRSGPYMEFSIIFFIFLSLPLFLFIEGKCGFDFEANLVFNCLRDFCKVL